MDTKTEITTSTEAITNFTNTVNARRGKNGGFSIKGIRKGLKEISGKPYHEDVLNSFKSSLENDFDGEISISHLGKTEMDFEGGNISGSRIHIFIPTYKPLITLIS